MQTSLNFLSILENVIVKNTNLDYLQSFQEQNSV
jgi:hypothetical protein